jgi:homoserine dehydrogenase
VFVVTMRRTVVDRESLAPNPTRAEEDFMSAFTPAAAAASASFPRRAHVPRRVRSTGRAIDPATSPAPSHVPHAPLRVTRTTGIRTLRLGILGLGNVGQAVARLAPDAPRLLQAGIRIQVCGALVRNVGSPRRCARPSRLTSNPEAFLRGGYDVVVEALGDAEPARTLVARLLGRGVPVVSANKALVAAHGRHLAALAARRGTAFRYEASALAGVPFLGALAARPLVSDVHHVAAIVNGTSNFILSKMDLERCALQEALAAARALGLAEPDPSRDLDGGDAADKLALLATVFGWGAFPLGALDVQSIRDLLPEDIAAARTLNATIKPIVLASRTEAGIGAFVGPAVVSSNHPLGALSGTLTGIHLSGRFISDLFFSGPGAGPDVTAATLLDDVVEAVSSIPVRPRISRRASAPAAITAPATAWFVRARFPGVTPDAAAVRNIFIGCGADVRHVTEAVGNTRWLRVAPVLRAQLTEALTRMRDTHRIQCHAIRVL